MVKRFVGLLIAGIILLNYSLPSFAASTSVDALIQKLVDKGILTEKESRELKSEIVSDEKMLREEGYRQGLPSWVQDMKLKGDFRLRLQSNFPKVSTDQSNVRTRGRVRMRLGLETKVNDKVNVGIGLAMGLSTSNTTDAANADTARSTNVTLGDSFGKKAIALDLAYVQFLASPWATLAGGKFKNPIWEPSDLLWDTDINPEGGALNLNKALNSKTTLFMNTLIGTLDEVNNDGDDPMLYVVQPGFQHLLTDNVTLKSAIAYHIFSNVKGRLLDGTASSNSTSGSGTNLLYGYTPLNPAMELSIRDPFHRLNMDVPTFLDIPNLTFFGEYVDNLTLRKHTEDKAKNNTGFAAGFRLGADKVGNAGQWQFKYIYAMLEKDAVPDILPDSDRYSGRTGIRSHEGILEYGLGKNASLQFDVYRSWRLGIKSAQLPETVAQADFNFKF